MYLLERSWNLRIRISIIYIIVNIEPIYISSSFKNATSTSFYYPFNFSFLSISSNRRFLSPHHSSSRWRVGRRSAATDIKKRINAQRATVLYDDTHAREKERERERDIRGRAGLTFILAPRYIENPSPCGNVDIGYRCAFHDEILLILTNWEQWRWLMVGEGRGSNVIVDYCGLIFWRIFVNLD